MLWSGPESGLSDSSAPGPALGTSQVSGAVSWRKGKERSQQQEHARQLVAVSVVLGSVSVIHRMGSPERPGFTLSVAALLALGTGTFAEWMNEG